MQASWSSLTTLILSTDKLISWRKQSSFIVDAVPYLEAEDVTPYGGKNRAGKRTLVFQRDYASEWLAMQDAWALDNALKAVGSGQLRVKGTETAEAVDIWDAWAAIESADIYSEGVVVYLALTFVTGAAPPGVISTPATIGLRIWNSDTSTWCILWARGLGTEASPFAAEIVGPSGSATGEAGGVKAWNPDTAANCLIVARGAGTEADPFTYEITASTGDAAVPQLAGIDLGRNVSLRVRGAGTEGDPFTPEFYEA